MTTTNFFSFDIENPSITNPDYMNSKIDKTVLDSAPKKIFVTFSNKVYNYILTNIDNVPIFSLTYGVTLPVYLLQFPNKSKVLFFHCPSGAPNAAGLLEELNALGIKTVVFFGSCGILESSKMRDKLLIPTFAVRDEGTSYHYMKANDTIEISTSDKLIDLCESLNIDYIPVMTWTTDAFYRETVRSVAAKRKQGCTVVEMECSAIEAVARFLDINVFQMLYGADVLNKEGWDTSHVTQAPTKGFNRQVAEVIKIINSL